MDYLITLYIVLGINNLPTYFTTHNSLYTTLQLDISSSILKKSSFMCPICIRDYQGGEVNAFQFLSTYGLDCHLTSIHDGLLRCTECKFENVNIR